MIFTYLGLYGPKTATELSTLSRIERTQVYRILHSLQNINIVECIMGRPIRFLAIPIRQALNKLLFDAEDRIAKAKENLAFLLEFWSTYSSTNQNQYSYPKVKFLSGRRNVFTLVKDMCKRAKKEIYTITTKNGLIRTVISFDEILEEQAKKGVKLKWLGEVCEENMEYVNRLCEIGEVRRLAIPSSCRLTIIDDELLFSIAQDDSVSLTTKQDFGIWTNEKNIISLLKFLFLEEWNRAEPIKEKTSKT